MAAALNDNALTESGACRVSRGAIPMDQPYTATTNPDQMRQKQRQLKRPASF